MKKLLLVMALAIAFGAADFQQGTWPVRAVAAELRQGDAVLADAFRKQTSNVQVQGNGVVVQVLPDAIDRDRQQRFMLRVASGQTIMIVHNVSLAPRIPLLNAGDVVEFNGLYEWNAQGGVVRWTHRDPAGWHPPGWLRHNGQTFQ